jgi:SEC-C motif
VTPIDQLRATKEKLPPELREQILALRAEAVPALIEILNDEQLGMSESPAEGWPPIHAVELLADLKATEAIEPMLDVLVETTFDHVINSNLLLRLPEFGAAVLEPTLLRLKVAQEEDVARALVAVLAKLGIKDERIFDAICDVFDEDLVFGAMYFADYGDDRALPMIEDAIVEFEPDFSSPFWRHDLTELVDAHQRLGGVLGEDLQAHVDALDESWKQHVASSHVGGQKIGRNDPCPCRSGKKYKKCCLGRAAGPSIVASPGGPREQLALADSNFRQKGAGRGPAQEFLDFAQPLLDSTDGSKAETQRALTLAQFLWNVAVTRETEKREAMLEELLRDITPDTEREEFAAIVRAMLQRHRELFPELHSGER